MIRRETMLRNLCAALETAARPLALAGALAAGATSVASPALAWWNADSNWDNGCLVNVQVLVDGDPAPLYPSPNGDARRYVQAFAGRSYSVVLHNNSGQRIAVLLAVDGLNVVNGERTSLASSEPMYVLSPWETATIRGWRTSLDEVRQFVFVDERRSYAERTGQANGDMGWIRVLSFREQVPVAWWNGGNVRRWDSPPSAYDDSRKDAPQAAQPAAPERGAPSGGARDENAPQASNELQGELKQQAQRVSDGLAKARESESFPGTGWGQRRNDSVREVEFHPMAVATDQLVLRYEYESGLRALGIFPTDRDRLHDRDNGQLGFAKPPRW